MRLLMKGCYRVMKMMSFAVKIGFKILRLKGGVVDEEAGLQFLSEGGRCLFIVPKSNIGITLAWRYCGDVERSERLWSVASAY